MEVYYKLQQRWVNGMDNWSEWYNLHHLPAYKFASIDIACEWKAWLDKIPDRTLETRIIEVTEEVVNNEH